jgi:hypothetical protein
MYLEHYVLQLLREAHAEWRDESFDGLLPALVRRIGDRELEVFALAILITDQTLTPLYVHVQLAESCEDVQWLECRFEELDERGNVLRTSYDNPGSIHKRLLRFVECGDFEERNWRYHFELRRRE